MKTTTITANTNHSDVQRFRGVSIRESAASAAAAQVNLRKGAVGGQLLMVIELAANESATLVLEDRVPSEGGVYVQVVSGTVEGVIYGD